MGSKTTVELPTDQGFGQISRVRGTLFRYVALSASLVGSVMLFVLLVRVVIAAFGLGTASHEWYLVYGATVILPIIGFGVYGWLNRDAGRVALRTTGILTGGVLVGTSIITLFVIFNPQQWIIYYSTAILPPALTVIYGRLKADPRAPLIAGGLFILGLVLGYGLWQVVYTFPVDWIIFVWTLAVPTAAFVGHMLRDHYSKRTATITSALVFVGAILIGTLADTLALIDPSIAVILYVSCIVPTGVYVIHVLHYRTGRIGVLLPLIVTIGVLFGRDLVALLGVTTPNPWLDYQFLTSAPSRFPEQAGLYPAIIGSVFIIALVAVFSFILGVGAAVYLEEYAPQTKRLGTLTRIIRINIANLAGVPSVVYGLLGLGVFINLLGMGVGVVLVAALTLSLLILPIVTISAQEAIRSVPDNQRLASYGMGATRWQTIRNVIFPRAFPGILTGTILALSRAIGETAPLLMIGAATTTFNPPDGLLSQTTAMPLQVFHWAFSAQPEFREYVAPAGIVTLLVILLAMNGVAILLRNKYQQRS